MLRNEGHYRHQSYSFLRSVIRTLLYVTDTMPRSGPAALTSLQTLFETKRGKVLPLSPKLVRLYAYPRHSPER